MQKRRTSGTRPKSSTWIHSEVTQTAQAGKNKKAIASIINNHNSITPSIQCNSPSIESRPITSTDIVTAPTSNWVKMRSTGPRTDSGKTRDQCDEESDLRARSCSNSYRQVHFVLHSHHDNRRVSGHIAQKRSENHTDEELRHPSCLSRMVLHPNLHLVYCGNEHHHRGGNPDRTGTAPALFP
jgi:hypothetical protein